MQALVSIIIPCYNGGKFIEKTIKNVLSQTYSNIECIVVDDGSTDNTGDVCKSLMNEGAQFVYLYKENGGVSSARNFGINHSKGTWIQVLDHDDRLNEDKIRFQLEYFEEFGKTYQKDVALYSDYEVVYKDKTDREIKRETNIVGELTNEQLMKKILKWDFKPNSPLHVNNVLFKRDVFKKKLFDERMRYWEDLEFWIDLLLKNVEFIYTPVVGMYYFIHKTNTSLVSGHFTKTSNSYLKYLEAISKKGKKLLRDNVHIEALLKYAIVMGNKERFNRLVKINRNPVGFIKHKIHIRSPWLLKLLFSIYGLKRRIQDKIRVAVR